MRINKYLLTTCLLGLLVGFSGCIYTPVRHVHVDPGFVPPPHAPAHGYRYRLPDGRVLVYDTAINVYVVTGYSNVYYADGIYYRRVRNHWETSRSFTKPWKIIEHHGLPGGLQAKDKGRIDKPKHQRQSKSVLKKGKEREQYESEPARHNGIARPEDHQKKEEVRDDHGRRDGVNFAKVEGHKRGNGQENSVEAKGKHESQHQHQETGGEDQGKDKGKSVAAIKRDTGQSKTDEAKGAGEGKDKTKSVAAKEESKGQNKADEAKGKHVGKDKGKSVAARKKGKDQNKTDEAKGAGEGKGKVKSVAARRKGKGESKADEAKGKQAVKDKSKSLAAKEKGKDQNKADEAEGVGEGSEQSEEADTEGSQNQRKS